MHEYHIVEKIVRDVVAAAQQHNAHRVTKVVLVMGEACGCASECVQMYFDTIAKGTLAEGAALVFKKVPVQFSCPQCSASFDPHRHNGACPSCHIDGTPTQIGKEFHVADIEIDA